MAMTTCKECKKEISNKAEVCPHCGYRLRDGKGIRIFRALLLMFIGIVMLGIVGVLTEHG